MQPILISITLPAAACTAPALPSGWWILVRRALVWLLSGRAIPFGETIRL